MTVYVGSSRVSRSGRMDCHSKEERKEGIQVGEYGVRNTVTRTWFVVKREIARFEFKCGRERERGGGC
jgi:hypothetical protein